MKDLYYRNFSGYLFYKEDTVIIISIGIKNKINLVTHFAHFLLEELKIDEYPN